jgi:hypothetical protein
VVHELAPWVLSWEEVDPRLHPFDARSAPGVVARLGPATDVPVRPSGAGDYSEVIAWAHEAGRPWTEAMTRALVDRYGRWVLGWRWVLDEGDIGGGPVGSWCCPNHSITTPEESLGRVTAALIEWREWLEDLAKRFDRFPLDALPAEDRHLAWQRATVHLVTHVVDRTAAGDAWYGHCELILTWFLTRWGVPPESARELVKEAVGGQFGSWVEPAHTVVEEAAARLAASLPGTAGPAPHA